MRFFSRPAQPQPDDLCFLLVESKPQASVWRFGGRFWTPRADLGPLDVTRQFFLGESEGRALWVLAVPPEAAGTTALPLRLFLASAPEAEAAAAIRAVEYNHWLAGHRYCGSCGTAMVRRRDDFALVCPQCAAEVFPRISPCVIMLIHRGDSILLARHVRSPAPVFSCLAGYVEVGERLEDTVAREVREEVGVEIGDPVYQESQPWPFPSQLMAGFIAPWKSGEPVPDGKEILEAGWFDRTNLPNLPPPLSLARRLIRRFYHDENL